MLVRFIASNFLSLKEEVEFNMLTGDFKTHPHHVYKAGKVEVLKAAAIYGANGAGKSNLVKAIDYLKRLITQGRIFESIDRKKFKLDSSFRQKPIRFEIELCVLKNLYLYGIAISNDRIEEEWLYRNNDMIFERKTDKSDKVSIEVADQYRETEKQKLLVELIQDNLLEKYELLLSKNKTLKLAAEIEEVNEYVTNRIAIVYPKTKYEGLVLNILESEDVKDRTNEALGAFDTGVKSINITELNLNDFVEISTDGKQEIINTIGKSEGHFAHIRTKDGPVLVSYEDGKYWVKKLTLQHFGTNNTLVDFELSEESDGTQRLLDYLPAISAIVDLPVTFIIDEVDQSVHVNLLKTLLQKVMDDKTTKGQLIFTTHESNLLNLNIFRQDEIWFAEKERETGATHFYSLSEFEPGYGSDIEKGYLNGRFGAIPFLGNLETLNWHPHAETE